MTPEDFQLRDQCRRFLSFHRMRSPAETMAPLGKAPGSELRSDYYGEGGAVELLETRLAALIEKEKALFFIKGVMAQQAVLRVYKEQRQSPFMAMHPLGHIDFDEANGFEILHGVHSLRLGRNRPFTLSDLTGVTDRLAAVVVELPLRRAGYLLPAWNELQAMSAWCREKGVPLHFDGARIWEAAAGYGKSVAEVTSLADSVYVSFYKGLGGLGGCALLGDARTIDAVRIWKSRLGGNLFTAYPYALAALNGLDTFLPRLPEFVKRARDLAAHLTANGTIGVPRGRPDVNAFTVLIDAPPGQCQHAHRAFAEKERVWLFNAFFEAENPRQAIGEITIGEAADDYSDEEALGWISAFNAKARTGQ